MISMVEHVQKPNMKRYMASVRGSRFAERPTRVATSEPCTLVRKDETSLNSVEPVLAS